MTERESAAHFLTGYCLALITDRQFARLLTEVRARPDDPLRTELLKVLDAEHELRARLQLLAGR